MNDSNKFLSHLPPGLQAGAITGFSGTLFAIDTDFRLLFINDAWFTFARENGAGKDFAERWTLGRSIMDAVPRSLVGFYEIAYRGCLATGRAWEHDYECSSPDMYRRYHQTVYPLRDARGLLILNDLIRQGPHRGAGRTPVAFDPAVHLDGQGQVVQCPHCRRTLGRQPSRRWDWVPELVARPHPRTRQDLCPACRALFAE